MFKAHKYEYSRYKGSGLYLWGIIMSKMYFSYHSRVPHTYRFYKKRRSEPEWKDDFIRIRKLRLKRGIFKCAGLILVSLIVIIGRYGFKAFLTTNNVIPSESSKVRMREQPNTTSKRLSGSTDDSSVSAIERSDVAISSSEKSTEQSISESTANDDSGVGRYLVGEHFTIFPITYDGENITQAMNSRKAPSNTVHDGHIEGEFLSEKQVKFSYVMGTTNSVGEYYTSKNILKFKGFIYTIPYYIDGDKVLFTNWTENINGHSVTMKMKIN